MRSKLLIGGLLASVMIIPALAQSNPPASAANPAPASTVTTTAPRAHSDLWRSSKLIGLNVYNDQNEKLGDISYYFRIDGERIYKTVSLFLLKWESGSPMPQQAEVDTAEWHDLERATELLSYKGEREIVLKAAERLAERALRLS